MSTPDYDVIAAEVHRKALQNITDEMAITLVRTSGSPIVTESKDFSTCLMDTKPEHLGFSSYVLFHVGSSLIGTQVIADLVKRASTTCAPATAGSSTTRTPAGAMHQGDVSIIMPTFYERRAPRLVLRQHARRSTSAASASPATRRAPTTSGRRACASRRSGSSATARSTPSGSSYIAANVRAPGAGAQRHPLDDRRRTTRRTRSSTEIIDEFGLEHAPRVLRDQQGPHRAGAARTDRAACPTASTRRSTGTSSTATTAPTSCSSCACELEVDGSDLRFTYTGVPQIDAFVNSTEGPMFGQAMTGLMTLLVYGDLPVNGGLWRPITVDIGEPGTIVNSSPAGAGLATPTPRSACGPASWPRTSSARRWR